MSSLFSIISPVSTFRLLSPINTKQSRLHPLSPTVIRDHEQLQSPSSTVKNDLSSVKSPTVSSRSAQYFDPETLSEFIRAHAPPETSPRLSRIILDEKISGHTLLSMTEDIYHKLSIEDPRLAKDMQDLSNSLYGHGFVLETPKRSRNLFKIIDEINKDTAAELDNPDESGIQEGSSNIVEPPEEVNDMNSPHLSSSSNHSSPTPSSLDLSIHHQEVMDNYSEISHSEVYSPVTIHSLTASSSDTIHDAPNGSSIASQPTLLVFPEDAIGIIDPNTLLYDSPEEMVDGDDDGDSSTPASLNQFSLLQPPSPRPATAEATGLAATEVDVGHVDAPVQQDLEVDQRRDSSLPPEPSVGDIPDPPPTEASATIAPAQVMVPHVDEEPKVSQEDTQLDEPNLPITDPDPVNIVEDEASSLTQQHNHAPLEQDFDGASQDEEVADSNSMGESRSGSPEPSQLEYDPDEDDDEDDDVANDPEENDEDDDEDGQSINDEDDLDDKEDEQTRCESESDQEDDSVDVDPARVEIDIVPAQIPLPDSADDSSSEYSESDGLDEEPLIKISGDDDATPITPQYPPAEGVRAFLELLDGVMFGGNSNYDDDSSDEDDFDDPIWHMKSPTQIFRVLYPNMQDPTQEGVESSPSSSLGPFTPSQLQWTPISVSIIDDPSISPHLEPSLLGSEQYGAGDANHKKENSTSHPPFIRAGERTLWSPANGRYDTDLKNATDSLSSIPMPSLSSSQSLGSGDNGGGEPESIRSQFAELQVETGGLDIEEAELRRRVRELQSILYSTSARPSRKRVISAPSSFRCS
ncbi:hypothetical protein ABKN59_006322 [Abortiporus biennis]